MASAETELVEGFHVIQVPEPNGGETAPGAPVTAAALAAEEISPLLPEVQGRPSMTIFSVSYPNNRRRPPKECMLEVETGDTLFCKFIMWLWSGSKYSGLLCIASSSAIYGIMEFFTNTFSGRTVPLFEVIFVRCTVISMLSFLWARRTGRPIFGPRNTRNILFLRSLMGYLSLICFIYSFQNLPLAYAMILNFSTPLMASIAARTILKEKLSFIDIGGLVCGFVGLLFIFHPKILVQEGLAESDLITIRGTHHIYPVLVGILSSSAGGISYCLTRAAAKAADQPVSTVLAFGVLASPLSAIWTFIFQEFMIPDLLTLFLMVVLGILAFLAEVSLARGLQLEKISKATTMQYLKVLLSPVWAISLSRISLSFSRFVGFVLVLASVCSTMYLGMERVLPDMDS